MVPFTYTPNDSYPTPTSILQSETEDVLRPFIPSYSSPSEIPAPQLDKEGLTKDKDAVLDKNTHLQYLLRNMLQGLPTRYVSFDASQAWLVFWTLQSFATLGVAMDPGNKQRAIDTILALQHPEGGFGGGPGQAPHLLPTYASVCALATVGRPGKGGGWDDIDREKLYKFFMSLKQPDGSFCVMRQGEVDTRGIYGLLCAATLLNMLTPELVEGTAEWLASCQGYEGGFGSGTYLGSPPLGEAHGGYTFCGVAGWLMLQPYLRVYPPKDIERPLNINQRTLLRWLVQMQGRPCELGGFRGRCNKLVDGCYSWWIGGAFALLDALNEMPAAITASESEGGSEKGTENIQAKEEDWVDDEGLYDRTALQEYILYAGQFKTGGLRDKPPKPSDPYHTLSCLSGLSSAQHRVRPSPSRRKVLMKAWKSSGGEYEDFRKQVFLDALSYDEEVGGDIIVGGKGNRVNAMHPIFNLTMSHTEAIMAWSYGQEIPARKSAPPPKV